MTKENTNLKLLKNIDFRLAWGSIPLYSNKTRNEIKSTKSLLNGFYEFENCFFNAKVSLEFSLLSISGKKFINSTFDIHGESLNELKFLQTNSFFNCTFYFSPVTSTVINMTRLHIHIDTLKENNIIKNSCYMEELLLKHNYDLSNLPPKFFNGLCFYRIDFTNCKLPNYPIFKGAHKKTLFKCIFNNLNLSIESIQGFKFLNCVFDTNCKFPHNSNFFQLNTFYKSTLHLKNYTPYNVRSQFFIDCQIPSNAELPLSLLSNTEALNELISKKKLPPHYATHCARNILIYDLDIFLKYYESFLLSSDIHLAVLKNK